MKLQLFFIPFRSPIDPETRRIVADNPDELVINENTITCLICDATFSYHATKSDFKRHKTSAIHKLCANFPESETVYKDWQEQIINKASEKGLPKTAAARYWSSHKTILFIFTIFA